MESGGHLKLKRFIVIVIEIVFFRVEYMSIKTKMIENGYIRDSSYSTSYFLNLCNNQQLQNVPV